MSDNAGFDVVGAAQEPEVTTEAPVADNSGGDNPAWNDLLGVIPGALHETVKGHLKNWDKGVNDRFQTVHSEYAPYKAFKEQGVAGEDLENAYRLYQAFNANPQAVYEQMAAHFGFGQQAQEQGQGQAPENVDEFETEPAIDISKDPRFQQQSQQLEQIQQFLQQQEEAQAAQAADAELDTALGKAFEKLGGEPDQAGMNYILNVADAHMKQSGGRGGIEAAILAATDAYTNLRNGIAATPRPAQFAPQITPSAGGGVPVQNQNPAELSPAERKALGARYLAQFTKG